MRSDRVVGLTLAGGADGVQRRVGVIESGSQCVYEAAGAISVGRGAQGSWNLLSVLRSERLKRQDKPNWGKMVSVLVLRVSKTDETSASWRLTIAAGRTDATAKAPQARTVNTVEKRISIEGFGELGARSSLEELVNC